MKFMLLLVLSLLFLSVRSFPVSTRYINDLRFDNIENFDSSNISFVENGGLTLSRELSVIFSADELIWDVRNWNDTMLVSASDTATLYAITGSTNRSVFKSKEHVLFSDILIWKERLYLSAIPHAAVYLLGKDYRVEKKIALSNEYVWQMVPVDAGVLLLTGSPASIQLMRENGSVETLFTLPTEDNILKGVVSGRDLYFICDGNILYRYSTDLKDKKPVAVASFADPISDILAQNGKIYLITAPRDPSRVLSGTSTFSSGTGGDDEGGKAPLTDKKSVRSMSGRSVLYSCTTSGTVEEIFDRNNVRFLSLSALDKSLFIGTDRSAGFFEIPVPGTDGEGKKKFTAAGKGKFTRMFRYGDELYAVLLEPSRIVRIRENYASAGSFLSSPFDTGNISAWGRIDSDTDVPSSTDLRIFSRSGAVPNEDHWDGWAPVKEKIASAPNRFFQYRVELTSGNGKNTPVFRRLTVPFVQNNIAPRFEKLAMDESGTAVVKVSWEAVDDNKDTLVYDIFLEKNAGEWVRVNEKQVEESSFELNTALIPEGSYRLKVTASDERSNPYSAAKTASRTSEPFLIDNTPPVISDWKVISNGDDRTVRFKAADALSDLFGAFYSLNGGKWISILPTDGLFDSRSKDFELKVRMKTPGFIQVRVVDVYGNERIMGGSIAR